MIAILFAVMGCFSLKEYRERHDRIKSFVDRCVSCKAVVIRPVVMEFTYGGLAKECINVIAAMADVPISVDSSSKNTVRTQVKYTVDGKDIDTVITRRSGIRHPKAGTEIDIFYDPKLPQHAFCEDMRKVLLNRELHQCAGNFGFSFLMFLVGLAFHISYQY